MSNEAPPPTGRMVGPNVHNGTWTVDSPRGHFTIELKTACPKSKLAGKRIISMLVGPNNRTDFRGVAFWDDVKQAAIVWRAHRGPGSSGYVDAMHWTPSKPKSDNPFATTKVDLDPHHAHPTFSKVEQQLSIWCDLVVRGDAGFWHAEGYSVLVAGMCVVCNRKLTDPESIRTGIGPVCAGRS